MFATDGTCTVAGTDVTAEDDNARGGTMEDFEGMTRELMRDIDEHFAGLDEQAALDAGVARKLAATAALAATYAPVNTETRG
jgi:hypothetical protein